MQLVLTTAGLAAINAASGPVTVVGYKLGSSVGYTPSVSDTDIHGSLVYSGVPSSPTIVGPSTYRYSIILDPTVGPFSFGEVALFLPGNELFAIGSFSTAQQKIATSGNVTGQSLYLDAYITVSGNNALVFLDAVNSNVAGFLPVAVSVDDLPAPTAATPNLWNVLDPLDNNAMRLATSTGSVWTVTGYERTGISGLVTEVTPFTVKVQLNQIFSSVVHNTSFLQFFSGPLMGVCRVIYDTAAAGTDTLLSLNTLLSELPQVGDEVQIFSRVTSYTTEVPATTRTLLDGLVPTLTAAELNQLDGVSVSNFIKKDGTVAFTGDQSLGGHLITNSGSPQNPNDLTTKAYVDTLATGRAPKASVHAASTTNINLSSPGSSIDGVNLSNGDSFLAKDQSLPAQNGIYVWSGPATPAARRADFDSPTNILPGSYFYATAGSTNAAKQFTLSTSGTIIVGTTPLQFITIDTSVLPPDVIRSTGAVAFGADQSMGGNKLINVATPTQSGDATNKSYVDSNFIKRDGTVTPTDNLNFGGLKIINLATPTGSYDSANKQYTDLKAQGINLSTDVRVATSSSVTLASMPATVDGITLTSGDAFLAKSQATASQNGIYTFNGENSPATRRADFASSGQVLLGFAVKVLEGSSANTVYVNTTPLPVTLGSTAIAFTTYSSSMSYVADIKADGSKAFTGNQSMGNHRLTNLAAPSASTDAATKGYVDTGFVRLDGSIPLAGALDANGFVYHNEGTPLDETDGANKLYVDLARQGIKQYADVRVASVATIVLSSPGANIDSIVLDPGDTFLAKDQTDPAENGLYTFNGSGSPATRREDFALAVQMERGVAVKVKEGTHALQVWVHTTSESIVVGNTALTFALWTSTLDISGYMRTDGTTPLIANTSAGGYRITNLGTPSASSDAATKAYVDQATGNPSGSLNAAGFTVINVATPVLITDASTKLYSDLKEQGINLAAEVKAASTGNLNLSSMPATVDGVTLSNGDAFLVKNQTSGSQNGVYVFIAPGSAAVRRSDFDTSGEALFGYAVRVLQGTTQAGQVWVHTTTGTVTLNSTALSFTQYSSSMNFTGYMKVDGSTPFTADQSMGNHKLTNLVDPVSAQDASTKVYVDLSSQASPAKDPVRVASTTNINLSSPGSTIDGVVMVNGDSFLAKDQNTGSQNGIYTWNGSSSAATRRADFSLTSNVKPGSIVFASEGNTNANKHYTLTTDAPIVVGSTTLTFALLVPTANTAIQPNGSVPFGADQSMGGFRLTTLGAPSVATDAAPKGYVDTATQASIAKDPVRVATTTNINLSSMPSSIDGVSLNNGDSFLAKDQSTASQNGIYVFAGAAQAATRRTDFNASGNVKPGSMVYVHSGSTNAAKYYMLVTASPITVDSTSLAFNLTNPNTGNIRSDGTVPFGSNQSMGNYLITNLGTAYSATDATNRQYVDYKEAGITFLIPVRLASTTNISVAAPGSQMDGVNFTSNDYFLLKNQTNGAENGVYIWNGSSTPATRRSDFNSSGLIKRGLAVQVQAGATQSGQIWVHNTAISNLVLGTTALSFTQYAAGQDYSLLARIWWDNSVTGSYTIDTSQYDEFQLTLTGPTTLTLSNPLPGRRILLKIKQDATGSRSLTLPVSVRYSSSIPSYTPTATANGIDRLGLYYDGVDGKWDLLALAKNFA